MREPAPPYRNEGPHALWHVSEDPSLGRFEPHVAATAVETEALVWAVDTRHLPLYWFPRDCPRATFWAHAGSAREDLDRLLGEGARAHAVEEAWLPRLRTVRLYAYRLPERPFVSHEVGGYWVAREPVEPFERVALADPVSLHEQAGIELRVLPSLWPLWDAVVASTLEYSGIRLRNAAPRRVPV